MNNDKPIKTDIPNGSGDGDRLRKWGCFESCLVITFDDGSRVVGRSDGYTVLPPNVDQPEGWAPPQSRDSDYWEDSQAAAFCRDKSPISSVNIVTHRRDY